MDIVTDLKANQRIYNILILYTTHDVSGVGGM